MRTAIATLALVLIVGCGGQGSTQSGGSPYKIGLEVSLTGTQSAGGKLEANGAAYAVKEINKSGGVNGRQLELITRDNQTLADVGVQDVNQLIQNGVIALSGDTGTAVLAAAPTIARDGVPFICNCGTAQVTQIGNKWLFRSIPTDRYVVEQVLKYMQKQSYSKLAVLAETSAYGDGAVQSFQDLSSKYNVKLAALERFAVAATDLSPQISRIKSASPDVLVVWTASQAAAIAMRNARQLGLTVPVIGGTSSVQQGMLAAAGDNANNFMAGAYGIVPGEAAHISTIKGANAQLKNFVAGYSTDHPGEEVSFWQLMAYDAIHLIAQALKTAGPNVGRTQLRDQLEKTCVDVTFGHVCYSAANHNGPGADAVVIMRYSVADKNWTRIYPG